MRTTFPPRILLLGLSIASVMVTLPASLRSQAFYTGAHGGVAFGMAAPFSEDGVCPSETTALLGAHLGRDLVPFLAIEGAVSMHLGRGIHCFSAPRMPIENGTDTLRAHGEEIRGYPFLTPEARLIGHSPSVGRTSARVHVGGAWMPSKRLGARIAGLGVRTAFGGLTGKLEVERWWFEVPFTDRELTFEDWQIVSVRTTDGRTAENPLFLRLGLEWSPF